MSADLSAIPPQSQTWPGTVAELTPAPDHGEQSWTGRDRLPGKRIMITGGDSGIGRATAIVCAKEGASIAITHLPEEAEDARATQAAVESAGGTCILVQADLRTQQANVAAAREAVQGLGGLDVLICNAAYQMTHGSLEEFPGEQIERTFATNVFGPFWLIQELAQELEGGSVVVTTSVQAYSPSEHLLDYAGTKAALNNMVVNLAAELGDRGIRVNAVAPGPIWTPLIPATMAEDKVEGFGSDTPLGRAGHPVEVAAAYVFLASDEASYVSGTVLGVTGGKPVF
ncbi:SDR family oxidoreductase [Arsenicicoccus dermatophilus]|uniref:SDR family oxidoreductase n=1 Tax=Arsenicicoccus dermatophilus TaxID=1076331 RepID=UPI001F4C795C|nr:SDR family oxidoreductase [Arsenicicoccus dermatophilus]MCH8611915.1 SDR family oxidoreductase [Arsenicicoccus dermatophilus]